MQAAATSTAATAELTTRVAVEGVRRDIQAQLDANRADALQRSEEVAKQVRDLSAQLTSLAEQLNKFNPVSGREVDVGYAKVISEVDRKFAVQQDEIKSLSTAILEQQKSLQSNNDTLHSVLTGVENLGENVKNLQEEMVTWQTEYQEGEAYYDTMNEQLLQEVPLAPENKEPTVQMTPPEIPTARNKVPADPKTPMPTIPEERTLPELGTSQGMELTPEEEKEVNRRWEITYKQAKVNGCYGPTKVGNVPDPAAQTMISQFFARNRVENWNNSKNAT